MAGPDGRARAVVAVGDDLLDLTAAWPSLSPQWPDLFAAGDLDRLLAAGPSTWDAVRATLTSWLGDERVAGFLRPAAGAAMRLPFTVADYVDFYSSEHHAAAVGAMFRPGQDPLPPNWKHLPIGYHGRAGTVVVSGTPVTRPRGQVRDADGTVRFAPSARLDLEAELGFVVGRPTALGTSVPLADFARHVFGVCLVNDWSARDIQAWETVPLGPFLGKSFATSVSPWVVPLAALAHARVPPPPRTTPLAAYLDDAGTEPWGLDIRLEVRLNGTLISRPPVAALYWTGAQQLAHLTVNGASLRTGDLFASGTVSGPGPDERGSLIELSHNGARPFIVDGEPRTFLADGDEVVISATAPGPEGTVVGLGEVRGTVVAAG
jgi:fumarylacetoacetase